jgi:hypothetical protein
MCTNSSGLFAFQLTSLAKLDLWCLQRTQLSQTSSRWSMWGIPLTIFLLASIFRLVKFKCPSLRCQSHSLLISHYSIWLSDDNSSWKEYNLSLEIDLHSACCALWLEYSKHLRCNYDHCRTLASRARRRGDPRLILGFFIFCKKGVAT